MSKEEIIYKWFLTAAFFAFAVFALSTMAQCSIKGGENPLAGQEKVHG